MRRRWPKTREEDLRDRKTGRGSQRFRAVLVILLNAIMIFIFGAGAVSSWLNGRGLGATAVFVGAALLMSLFLYVALRWFRSAGTTDVVTVDEELPGEADLEPGDPRKRFPRWLRLTILVLELPVLLVAFFTFLVLGATGVQALSAPVWSGLLVGIPLWVAFRVGVAWGRHELTGR